MSTPPYIFPTVAALPAYPTLLESVGFQLVGLIVVFTALGLIWMMLEITGAWFRHLAASLKNKPAIIAPGSTSAVAPPPAPAANTDEAHLPVIIAAAVHSMLQGRRHRIVAITTAPEHQAWSVEGRRHIFSSHKVR